MDIQGNDYEIWYEPELSTIFLKGILRLEGKDEYQPLMNLMLQVIEASKKCILDLRQLEFLNSSGISTLTMFVVKARQMGDIELAVHGSDQVLWQTKSLKNLQRLMPQMQLEFR